MRRIRGLTPLLLCLVAACARDSWPQPPAVDAATYQREYAKWREEQQTGIGEILAIVGIWPLAQGDTAFGSDASLPIVLPASVAPARAGVFHRAGDSITIVPATQSNVRMADGAPMTKPTEYTDGMAIGSVHLRRADMPGGRIFITGVDQANPAMSHPPTVEAFPVDQRFRIAARFDAYPSPRIVKIGDVRGGTIEVPAAGQLVFRLDGREWRLTAFDEGPEGLLGVLFKDRTNGSTTYGGYRILSAPRVKNGEFTVLDFNMAENPPCAYSPYTTCPLPPPENKLDVAVEAGLKRLPSVQGYTSS